MLEDHLLYAEEQLQYREVVAGRKPGKGGGRSSLGKGKGYKEVVLGSPPSTVYGFEHLIRLFGKQNVRLNCLLQLLVYTYTVVLCFTVKMPLFLSRAKFPSSHVNLLHQYFKDLLG